jgi:hypothetical protein
MKKENVRWLIGMIMMLCLVLFSVSVIYYKKGLTGQATGNLVDEEKPFEPSASMENLIQKMEDWSKLNRKGISLIFATFALVTSLWIIFFWRKRKEEPVKKEKGRKKNRH